MCATLCYMDRVGVRELRQNASALLDLVADGAVIEITNHGRPVARLVPIASTGTSREDLLAHGHLRPGRGKVLDVEPVTLPSGTPSTEDLLAQLREES